MDQACKGILGTRVRIPVEIDAYYLNSGYRDPRDDLIESMQQGVLPNQEAEIQTRVYKDG